MKYFRFVLLFVFFIGNMSFSQEKPSKHTVKRGETISEIAENYDVNTKSIYELNPKAKKGIKYKEVLLIPSKHTKNNIASNKENIPQNIENTHEVKTKETIWGISKKYKISVNDLYKYNPNLEKKGLEIGQKIVVSAPNIENSESIKNVNTTVRNNEIPNTVDLNKKSSVLNSENDTKKALVYVVLPKESLYVIARKYGISVVDLKKANPTLSSKNLSIGQEINIPEKLDSNSNVSKKEQVAIDKNEILPKSSDENVLLTTEITHVVLRRETKYSIANKYGISVDELESLNPDSIKKIRVGSLLKIRNSKPIEKIQEKEIAVTKKSDSLNSSNTISRIYDSEFVNQLIVAASENLGTRYRSGGTSKDGFDCSGLMISTFGAYDVKLPRSSIEQAQCGVSVPLEEAKKGDLIFFRTRGHRQINHVGMVVEVFEGEVKFIHSSIHNGVIISSIKEEYYDKSFAEIKRVL